MKILLMVTADYAAVEPQTGKLNIIGVFDHITAKAFPFQHRRMYLGIKFEGEMSENSGPYRLLITLASEDGQDIAAIEGSIEMPTPPSGLPPKPTVVVEFNQLEFQKPGDYRFYIRLNGGEVIDESMVIHVAPQEE